MLWVHAGVLAGSSEEVIDGYVIHNDEHGISASWSGLDSESGIRDYIVSIGTSPGIHVYNYITLTKCGQ